MGHQGLCCLISLSTLSRGTPCSNNPTSEMIDGLRRRTLAGWRPSSERASVSSLKSRWILILHPAHKTRARRISSWRG
jgi:hypothetical protein